MRPGRSNSSDDVADAADDRQTGSDREAFDKTVQIVFPIPRLPAGSTFGAAR
jgi:hypothetical protein